MNSGLVVYVGPYSFPDGGAAARRIYGNALSLRNAGFNVIVASGQMRSKAPDNDVYDDFSVVSLEERRFEKLPRLIKHLFYFSMGQKTIDWLDQLTIKPKAVILYSGYSPYLIKLLRWTKKNNVKLIFDAVEWYIPPNVLGGFISPYYINIFLSMRCLSIRTKNIIAISSYLEEYYRRNNCATILIPPTLDHAKVKVRLKRESNKLLKLVYTGIPERKDSLDNIIEAAFQLHQLGVGVELHIAGVSNKLFENFDSVRRYQGIIISNIVINHGYIEHSRALELVRMSDFSILIRPVDRSTQAGFSTKFVESMSVGTPVIANLTSDLNRYLIDGVNGFVCEDNQVVTLLKQLHRAARLDDATYNEMRCEARNLSEKNFDYRRITSSLSDFINH